MSEASILGPALMLGGGLVGILAVGLAGFAAERAARSAKAVLFLAIGLSLALLAPNGAPPDAVMRQDGIASLWQGLFLLAAVPLVTLMPLAGELPVALVASALLGMSLMATANHLVLLFVGLELMSLPSYLLVYRLKGDKRSLEAAIKYFFAGSVGSAFFLYGASLFYSLTGSLGMGALGVSSPRLELALALMAAGALFKVGAVPLHFWLPDVYEASAPELVGFFSTGVKAAGLLFLFRLLMLLPPSVGGVTTWLPAVCVATMTVGNLLALRQTSLQRLLAYSSVAHVGYLLLGVWAWAEARPATGAPEGPAAVYVYAAAYLFMSSGAFIALKLSGLRERRELAGFGARRPGLAAFLTLMLLSLASIPPTAGFLAKFLVFWDALKAGGAWLAAAAALNSIVGLGYYFGLIRDIYLSAPQGAPVEERPIGLGGRALMAACAVPTLVLGLWPGAFELALEWLAR